MPSAHSEKGPSKAHRWRRCPGSIAAERGLPDDSGIEAAEGQVFHEYADLCLTFGLDPHVFVGKPYEHEKFGLLFFTQEMADNMLYGLDYLRDIAAGREARYIGHNPAGGAMILVLLATIALTAATGWLETTDSYYGIDWVQDTHSYAAHAMLVLVALHVCGVIVASLRHRENLVRAMVTGRKRPL